MKHTALITGATGGIGEAIARRLAREGISLQLHFHQNEQKARQLEQELTDLFPIDVQLCQANLSAPEGPDLLVRQLVPKPNIIIHNAGQAHYSLFTDIAQVDYEQMIQLHVTSPFVLTQKLLPSLINNRKGRIIFVTSIWAETGAACESLYSLAKGGITALMKSLAKELAPSGITVNAVAPGVIDTPMMRSFNADELAELSENIPVGRLGKPDEVAHCVQFLVDEQSSYMTGQVLRVNGGWHM